MRTDQLAGALAGWLGRLMPAQPRRDRLLEALGARFGSDGREVGGEVCAELQAEARRFSRHLDLEWVPEGGLVLDTASRGWPAPDRALRGGRGPGAGARPPAGRLTTRRRAAGRRPGGCGA